MNFYLIDGRRINLDQVTHYEAGPGEIYIHMAGVIPPIYVEGPRVPVLLKQLDSAVRVSELPVLVGPLGVPKPEPEPEPDPGPNVFDRLACSGFEEYGARGIKLLFINPDARDKALSVLGSDLGLPQPEPEPEPRFKVGDRVVCVADGITGTVKEVDIRALAEPSEYYLYHVKKDDGHWFWLDDVDVNPPPTED